MTAPFTVSITTWQRDFVALCHVRTRVFVLEQNVPPEEEIDAIDASCVHAVARDAAGKPVGCGRLLDDGRIGRMAVLKEWRGTGVGGAVLQALIDVAQSRGNPRVYLHSQTHAIPFYAKYGFVAHGPEFMDCDIPHREMTREF